MQLQNTLQGSQDDLRWWLQIADAMTDLHDAVHTATCPLGPEEYPPSVLDVIDRSAQAILAATAEIRAEDGER